MITTQVHYRRHKNAHIFQGADNLSHGVMAGDANMLTAFDKVAEQIELNLEQTHQIKGKAVCFIPRDKLEEALKDIESINLLYTIDTFGR